MVRMVGKNLTEIKKIKEYANINKVPIMMDDGIEFLTTFIIKHNVKTILEIGSAIGYSAIMMALTRQDIKIVTIEKDEKRYLEAIKNIKKLNLEDRITIIYNDALEVNLKEKFDLIFIDAAKSKSIEFFEHFESNLNPNGHIITDNINLHGNVKKDLKEIKNRNLRALVRKIRKYITYLEEHQDYKTTFYECGDGISVTERSA